MVHGAEWLLFVAQTNFIGPYFCQAMDAHWRLLSTREEILAP